MDRVNKKEVKNPRKNPNWLSTITFAWLFDIFLLGWKRNLTLFDLSPPIENHTSQWMGHQILHLWNLEKEKIAETSEPKRHPSLLRVLTKLLGKKVIVVGVVQAFGEIITKVIQPIFLVNILRYFDTYSTVPQDEAFMWGAALLVSNIIYCFVAHVSMYYMAVISMEMRIACCALIYDKIMRISKAVMESKTSAGQMINIFSSDISRMESLLTFAHYGWISPILVLVIICFIYKEMEIPGLLGFCILALFIPIQGYIAKLVSRLISKHATKCDERLRLTNEIIRGVEVIKMYAWEKPFTNLVNIARKMEMKIVTISKIAYGISLSFEHFVPRTCLFVTLVAYVFFGNQITAEKVFMVTAYYNVMRLIAFRLFAVGMNAIGEMKISIDRIQDFMNFDEIPVSNCFEEDAVSNGQSALQETAIEFHDVTAKWTNDVKDNTLEDVTFSVRSGSLVAIIGQVGSGKTSIFHAILDELPLSRGKVKVSGKISYCSQEPWLFASSIQENILFGQPMNEEKYEKVISICQLLKDITMLPHGDKTLIGERGINLSGGQRARVNLARAIYVDADIYLLDDPLSAIDANVGKRLFEKCIKTYLKGKTVVLVTHQYQYLKNAEKLIVLNKGKIAAVGSLDDLQESGVGLIDMLEVSKPKAGEKLEYMQRQMSTLSISSTITSIPSEDVSFEEDPIMKDEVLQVGAIPKGVYLAYLKAARSTFYVLFVFVMAATAECFAVGGDYFVAYWLKSQEPLSVIENRTTTVEERITASYWYISVYGSIIACTIVLVLMQSAIYFEMCRRISNNLYETMFLNVIRATMSFFNDNSMGRIMNRFSKDVVVVDRMVSQSFRDVMTSFITFVIVIILVTIVNPWLIIPTLLVALLFILFRMFYVKTSRCIKRLEGITRSPVFTHLSATLQGLTTIRALKAHKISKEEFDNHQNVYSAVWIISAAGDRALSFYMDILCSLLIGLITFTILALKGSIEASDAGLVITQCILLVGVLQWGIRQSSELETNMTSVERILEFSNLKGEPPLESLPQNKPPDDWPTKGHIEFRNVFLMYDEDAALDNLNFSIASKEKVGIVGRTGAGKSSLITALFRLADIEGDIYIDGIATSTLGLHDFRSKISIIPQEPVLFVGNLRCNLDPFDEFQDNDLWQALDDVEMKPVIAAKEGLDMNVSDGGSNFSVGERQLLCLARAILRKNPILVLDEATANVDPKTDELIQQTVRRKFQDCTVLTIAHRLNTVMDSDRILVMNAGTMVEFGHPIDLLQNKNGYLYNMVNHTGRITAQTLYNIAKENSPSQCTKL